MRSSDSPPPPRSRCGQGSIIALCREDPPPQGQGRRSVPWLLKRLYGALSLHPGQTSAIMEAGGRRQEGGIEPDKHLAYRMLIPRARGIQERESAQSKENVLRSGTYMERRTDV